MTETRPARPYDLFMLALSLYALAVLAAETLLALRPETVEVLRYADTGVCVLFFADFVRSLVTAPNRRLYFMRWGWLDLLSSVPMVSQLRVGRIARVVRVFRVLRGVRATKTIANVVLRKRAEGVFLAAALLSILLTVFASIAILQFETAAESNIRTAGDALWWAFGTIATVGYGDRYPVSGEGRVLAAILMTAGVGLFGTFSGFVAAWFLAPSSEKTEGEFELLRKELAEVRAILDARSTKNA